MQQENTPESPCFWILYVIPGGIFGGPLPPKITESFLFPGFYHLAALMKEGLKIWDASQNRVFVDFPFLHLGTADGPGMAMIDGLVGHTGAYGCRIFCPVKSRHKLHASTYYPALLKPDNYTVQGCDHDDVSGRNLIPGSSEDYHRALFMVMDAKNDAQHAKRRLGTGISKPTLFSGLSRVLSVPSCFPVDIMHLIINLFELFLGLWRGTLDCDPNDDVKTWAWAVLKDEVWKRHGERVANATPYLPGSFDRPPRNIAEKISSGYKAQESLTYLFGLGPGLLYGILPDVYWRNYCKIVHGYQIIFQKNIPRVEVLEAHTHFYEAVEEFEALYYQRMAVRLHFCRQSIHQLLHQAPEVVRVGPGACYSQWTMERTIGNLGEELKQHSNPYANISQRAVRRAQVNALKSMIPDLEPAPKLPHCSENLGHGYILLHARDEYNQVIRGAQGDTIREYLEAVNGEVYPETFQPHLQRWARLRLPNGQIARSAWKEKQKALNKVRMARNVRFTDVGDTEAYAEVQFFFQTEVDDEDLTLALICRYSSPDPELLKASCKTLLVCDEPDATVMELAMSLPPRWEPSMSPLDMSRQPLPDFTSQRRPSPSPTTSSSASTHTLASSALGSPDFRRGHLSASDMLLQPHGRESSDDIFAGSMDNRWDHIRTGSSSGSLFNPTVAEATHQSLIANRNLQYMKLYDAYSVQDDRYKAAQTAYEELKVRFDTLHSAYTLLVTAVSDKLSAPATVHTNTSDRLVSSSNSVDHLKVLEQADHENITYWTETEYLQEHERRKKANGKATMTDAQSKRGSKRLSADDENMMLWFIEDKDGEPITGQRAKAARAQARKIWIYLNSEGRLPASQHWNDADSVARSYYAGEMRRYFPELMLCELDYKAHRIATLIFSGWIKTFLRDNELKVEPGLADEEAEETVAGKKKRSASQPPEDEPAPKRKSNSNSKPRNPAPAAAPLPQPSPPSPVAAPASRVVDTPSNTEPTSKRTDSMDTEPVRRLPIASLSVGTSAMTGTAPAVDHSAAPAPLEAAPPQRAVSAGQAVPPRAVSAVEPILTTTYTEQVDDPLAALGNSTAPLTRTEFVEKATRKDAPKATRAKKNKAANTEGEGMARQEKIVYLRASGSKTARNLCLMDYITKKGRVTKAQFDPYFDNLSAEDSQNFSCGKSEVNWLFKKRRRRAKRHNSTLGILSVDDSLLLHGLGSDHNRDGTHLKCQNGGSASASGKQEREQGTGSGERGTGNGERGTGNGEQGAGSRVREREGERK
ncbi:hypothetical protein C8R43DRAFT_1135395 [Mycena crocata]|nr:hypothetical protein C8R43DRAFT_1135395 [Mycena crocata]